MLDQAVCGCVKMVMIVMVVVVMVCVCVCVYVNVCVRAWARAGGRACVCVCVETEEREITNILISVSCSNDQIVLGSSKYTSLNMCVHASPETVRPDRTRGAAVGPPETAHRSGQG